MKDKLLRIKNPHDFVVALSRWKGDRGAKRRVTSAWKEKHGYSTDDLRRFQDRLIHQPKKRERYSQMDFRSRPTPRSWSRKEIAEMIRRMEEMTSADFAEKFGRSFYSVMRMRTKINAVLKQFGGDLNRTVAALTPDHRRGKYERVW
ncbi:MAG: hypothetical protein HY042_03605 [Spirochaetia bacterium]|nr:hypothetical protein [Spirochaetia bacterium]